MNFKLIRIFKVISFLLIILLLKGAFVLCEKSPIESLSKEYYVKVTKGSKISVLARTARGFGLKYIRQASPNVHIFSEQVGKNHDGSFLAPQISNFSVFFDEEITDVQEVRQNHVRYFKPTTNLQGRSLSKRFRRTTYFLKTCKPYYGMDIEETWALNFTGYGINVGVLDLGFEINHADLKRNMNTQLGYNFVDRERRSDFLPNYESKNYPEADDYVEHGNNIAGLIAALKGNELCSAGVAYNASIPTTSMDNSCSDDFKGSSAATAIGAAIIALGLLDRLSWRDVQYILIFTSSLENLKSKLPTTANGKGLKYNPYFGFGMMNATSFSIAARSWISVPQQVLSTFYHSTRIRLTSKPRSKDPDAYMAKVIVKECGHQSQCVRYIEHVVAEITYTGIRDKLISFFLYSPSNTKSVLLHDAQKTLPNVSKHKKMPFRRTWNFTSVQFWGESPTGDWTLFMTQYDTMRNKSYKHFTVHNFTLFVYGTAEDPYKYNSNLFRHKQENKQENNQDLVDDSNSFIDMIQTNGELDRAYYAVLEGDTRAILEEDADNNEQGHVNYIAVVVISISVIPFVVVCLVNCLNNALSSRTVSYPKNKQND